MKDTFLMIDGNSLLHRAFHALPLMDAGGIYTNAIYGFLTMMLKAIADENARYLAVCFDEHAPTFRHTAYPDYKAGRAATPDELRQQFATIRTLLPEMGIQVFSLQGWEADDLLGTLSKLGEDAKVAVRNVRRDAMDKAKAMKKAGELTEDTQKTMEEDVQKLTDKYIKNIDAAVEEKQKEIMAV